MILMPFGDLTDAQWKHLTMHSFHRTPDQRAWMSRHDPAIARTYRLWQFVSVDMWATWNQVACPTLVIRGERSDFLPPHVVSRMQVSGPRAAALEVPGCGHAPALMDDRQIEPLMEFLETISLAPTGSVETSSEQPGTR
jgi:pimeloyl-ACP methyl ester carboxylesterase